MRFRQGLTVAAAMGVLAFAATALAAEQTAPAPRAANAHPDLTGLYRRVATGTNGRAFGFLIDHSGENTNQTVREGNMNYVEIDSEFIVKAEQDMPEYKAAYWDQVRNNEEFAYRRPADPQYGCKNPGVVRLSSPAEIFQSPNKITLVYTGPIDDGTSAHLWVREVPTDGRPLPKPDDYEGLRPTGTSVGHWEGDTLVIVSVDFPSDGVWYNTRGWVGSAEAKVTERFRRDGDTLVYDQTVDDPAFVKPWVRPTQHLALQKGPQAILVQPLTCIERDGALLPPSSK